MMSREDFVQYYAEQMGETALTIAEMGLYPERCFCQGLHEG